MLTNFELKQLKPKLDIVKKPENRVHELTDSNVSPSDQQIRISKICLPYDVGPARAFLGEENDVWFRPCIAGQNYAYF